MKSAKDKLYQRIKVLLYSSLLSLGLYWIANGNSFSQYFAEKTSFAEFSEPLSELPTIHTYLNIPNRTELQVWSLTQLYSVDFSQSRIGVKSAYSTNPQSRFASIDLDGVLGPLRLARHT